MRHFNKKQFIDLLVNILLTLRVLCANALTDQLFILSSK